ncbi:MAG: LysR family transcriptional regulator [Clostridia bacterium]|nr:LysR family transcriptional regulator [Clostridia bacterium]
MYNKYLDIFIEVVECGSFTKASEKLFISSTAIMKQMNLMENDVGVKLLERTNHGIKLTNAGKQIYKDAKHIVQYCKNSISHVNKLVQNDSNTITVGTSVICPCKPLMDIWYKINDKYPNYKIKIVPFEDNHTDILTTLKGKDFDFDCIVTPCDSAEWKTKLNFLQLGNYEYTASVPRNHKLSNKKKIDYSDLDNETIMMICDGDSEKSNYLRESILEKSKNVTIEPTPFWYDIDVFNRCEENGNVLMSLNAWKDVHPSLVNIPFKNKVEVPYGIIYSKNPTKSFEFFINCIKDYMEKDVT